MKITENGSIVLRIDEDEKDELLCDLTECDLSEDEMMAQLFVGEFSFPKPYFFFGCYSDLHDLIGALKGSPLIGRKVAFDSDGELYLREGYRVYWYPDYAVESPVDALVKNGFVKFERWMK